MAIHFPIKRAPIPFEREPYQLKMDSFPLEGTPFIDWDSTGEQFIISIGEDTSIGNVLVPIERWPLFIDQRIASVEHDSLPLKRDHFH